MSSPADIMAETPKIAFTIDLHSNQDDLNSHMKAACKQLLPGWDTIADTDIQVGYYARSSFEL